MNKSFSSWCERVLAELHAKPLHDEEALDEEDPSFHIFCAENFYQLNEKVSLTATARLKPHKVDNHSIDSVCIFVRRETAGRLGLALLIQAFCTGPDVLIIELEPGELDTLGDGRLKKILIPSLKCRSKQFDQAGLDVLEIQLSRLKLIYKQIHRHPLWEELPYQFAPPNYFSGSDRPLFTLGKVETEHTNEPEVWPCSNDEYPNEPERALEIRGGIEAFCGLAQSLLMFSHPHCNVNEIDFEVNPLYRAAADGSAILSFACEGSDLAMGVI